MILLNRIFPRVTTAFVVILAINCPAFAGAGDKAQKPRNQSTTAKSSANPKADARSRVAYSTQSKRDKVAKLRQAEAKRAADEQRRANAARERTRDEDLREDVQSMIEKDDLSGEDPEIRRAALNALGNHAGTVVVMNPQTGRIYSIVNQQWALREGFKPCSTIKLVTALAGLSESVIDPANSRISSTNHFNLTRALAYSNNGYFQQVGEQVGFEKMLSYARTLGLGEKTGVNVRNESKGRVPRAKSSSSILRMSSHGDYFEVTPLQLATLVSAIGNGGKLLRPYITRTRQDESKFKIKIRHGVDVNRDAWQELIPGLVGAVNYGTGRAAHDPSMAIAGKTGTCIQDGTWVGLFTSYAPSANPQLAVVVITRGRDARSHVPAAVAGSIYRELSGRFSGSSEPRVATRRAPAMRRYDSGLNDEEEASAVEEMKPRVMERATPKASVPSSDTNIPSDGQTRPRRVTIGG